MGRSTPVPGRVQAQSRCALPVLLPGFHPQRPEQQSGKMTTTRPRCPTEKLRLLSPLSQTAGCVCYNGSLPSLAFLRPQRSVGGVAAPATAGDEAGWYATGGTRAIRLLLRRGGCWLPLATIARPDPSFVR